jgi:hypothetical protein
MKIKGYEDEVVLIPESDEELTSINDFFITLQKMKSASGKSADGEVLIIKTERASYPEYSINVK